MREQMQKWSSFLQILIAGKNCHRLQKLGNFFFLAIEANINLIATYLQFLKTVSAIGICDSRVNRF